MARSLRPDRLLCYTFCMGRIILIMIFLLPAVAYAAPSVKFETVTHDFGKVNEGDKLEFSFQFENSGTDDLVIEKLQTS